MLGLLLLLTSVIGLQQAATPATTAEIVGTVFDHEGGVIPGATVSLQAPDGVTLQKAVTGITHVTGVVSMARGTAADTATSDFFVLLDDQPSLDFGGQRFDDGQGGAAFGRVVSGLDVVRKIQQQPVDGQNLSAPVTIWRVWRLGGK